MGEIDDVESTLERVRLMDWMSLGSVGGYVCVVLASLIAGEGILNLWFIAGGIAFTMLAAGRIAGSTVRKQAREQIATSSDQAIERTAQINSGIDLAAVTGLIFSAAGIGGGAGIWTVVIGVLLGGTGFLLARAAGERIHDLNQRGEERLAGRERDRVLSDRTLTDLEEPDDRAESDRGRPGTRV